MEIGSREHDLVNEKPSLTPEALISRLGDYLVARKAISEQDLAAALALQASEREKGETKLLGQILVEMKKLSKEELDHFITEQILNLRNALQKANLDLEDRVKQRTKELEQAYQRLSEMSTIKSQFVANISHELRTPMTHIKGYIELLRSGDLGGLSLEQMRAVETMNGASDHLEKLIENLILFGMMERNEVTLNQSLESLNEVVLAASDQFVTKQQNHDVPIKYELWPGNPKVFIDRSKMIWVLTELIDNACKFSREHGIVFVSTSMENNQARVTITDNGIGIPQEKFAEIFEPFYQVDGSSTRKYSGMGLGLALVRQILQAHNSDIHIDSTVGAGASFYFLLSTGDTHG